ncbi:MAG TPA: GGDEF domain-containing protein [Cellvibrionaceae bacterium]|nr:GGDEF domain-containing protein [Cellvibrionaceae bacterium]
MPLARLRSFNMHLKPEWILGIAAVVSLLLIVIPKDLLTRTDQLNLQEHRAVLFADAYSGGNSSATWIDEGQKHWQCKLGQNLPAPYCSIRLALTDEKGGGLDLSRALSLTLWIDYKGNGSHLRIYLRNRGIKHYVPGDDLSEKYNMVEIPVQDMAQGFTINMDEFGVADWWLTQRNIPLKEARPEFNNISDMEIQTGSLMVSGDHEVTLRAMSWETPFISELQLYRLVTILWTGLIITFLLFRITAMHMALNRQQAKQQELIAINGILSPKNRRFEDLAKTDQLTGLHNRVAMQEALYQGLNNWKHHREAFSMVLLDIDHFKKINDNLGHDAGDEVLKLVAGVLKSSVRKSDFLARWGGEEFVLLYPNTSQMEALAAAESLRQKIASALNPWGIVITASFGVATLVSGDLDLLFKSADEALYRAKNSGRNCVMGDLRIGINAQNLS